jgi:hypothetical protein
MKHQNATTLARRERGQRIHHRNEARAEARATVRRARTEAAIDEARVKRTIGYDPDTPRCSTCRGYRAPVLLSKGRGAGLSDPWCGVHAVPIRPVGCCDSWIGRDGETLED